MKYKNLCNNNQPHLNVNCVKNISSKQLTENQFKVLAKGKNYALPHSNKDVFEFLAVTDNAVDKIEHIDREQKADIKTQVLTALKCCTKGIMR